MAPYLALELKVPHEIDQRAGWRWRIVSSCEPNEEDDQFKGTCHPDADYEPSKLQ